MRNSRGYSRAISTLSGFFKLVDPATFIETQSTAKLTSEETDFVGWAALGAQAS